jgi:hypothetical protein
MEAITLETITLKYFEALLNSKVEIIFTDTVKLIAQIIDVTDLKQNNLGRTPFSVIFRTEQKTEYYNQGIYGIKIPEADQLDLFLVPLGYDSVGMRYEAIFS